MPRHDRTTDAEARTRGRSHFANEREVAPGDEVLLATPTGREAGAMSDRPNAVESEARSIDVEAQPMSERTADPDPSAPEETADGLDETAEAVRQAAERRRLPPAP